MRNRGDLLIDAKSRQIPPINSRHTVPHTTAHAPAGSSDMVVAKFKTWKCTDHVHRRRFALEKIRIRLR